MEKKHSFNMNNLETEKYRSSLNSSISMTKAALMQIALHSLQFKDHLF